MKVFRLTCETRTALLVFATALTAVLFLAPAVSSAQDKKLLKRHAMVYYSDGTQLEGMIQLNRGIKFRLTEAAARFGKTHTFNFNVVKEMTFDPGAGFYRRQFRIKDITGAGIKEYHGAPYPVLEPKCTVTFNSGEKKTGTLYSTSAYLKEKDPETGFTIRTRKLILESKLKGQPGQSTSDLVYVERIKMLDEGDVVERSLDIELLAIDPKSVGQLKTNPRLDEGKKLPLTGRWIEHATDPDAMGELKAITKETLSRVKVERDEKDGSLNVLSTLGENVFLATRVGDRYLVGWPKEGTEKNDMFVSVENQLKQVQDYYNEKELIGIIPQDGGKRVFALVKLRRKIKNPEGALEWALATGPNVFEAIGGELAEFFRLSVWLFHRDPDSGDVALVDRGTFFRVRVGLTEDTPEMGVTADLWPVVKQGGKVIVGNPGKEMKQ